MIFPFSVDTELSGCFARLKFRRGDEARAEGPSLKSCTRGWVRILGQSRSGARVLGASIPGQRTGASGCPRSCGGAPGCSPGARPRSWPWHHPLMQTSADSGTPSETCRFISICIISRLVPPRKVRLHPSSKAREVNSQPWPTVITAGRPWLAFSRSSTAVTCLPQQMLVQGRIGHQRRQLLVFPLQLLKAPRLRNAHAGEFALPAVEALPGNAQLAADIHHRRTRLGLAKGQGDLLPENSPCRTAVLPSPGPRF